MRRSKSMIFLVVCLLWICAIFLLSSQNGQNSHGLSSRLAEGIGTLLCPDFAKWPYTQQREWIYGMEALLRKAAHFTEYALLGILSACTVSSLLSAKRKRGSSADFKTGMLAFYPCLLVSLVDEIIQLSSAGRTSSAADVILDSVGVVTGIIIGINRIKAMPAASAQSAAVRKRRKG